MNPVVSTLDARSSPAWKSATTRRAAVCERCGRHVRCCPDVDENFCGYCVLGSALEETGFEEGTSAHTLTLPPGASRLGPYALCEEIGRGGMGVIYRAIHIATGQTAAVKTVLPEYLRCSETLARFQREAEVAQRICHPHSMPIIEVGRSAAGMPYFSMPLALGGSLYNLREKYRRRWRQIAELLVKVASAVHQAHALGILHRDLKPGNILFTEDHEPLVTDFGLAKQLIDPGNLTYSCAVLGTPNYVAPEQAAGRTRDLSAATDIYSLGAILFELLTGRPPFVGENPLDVLRQVAEQRPPRPSSLVPGVPEGLELICLRCLEHEPPARYESANELAVELGRWLDGQKILASPRRTRRWRRILTNRLWLPGLLSACVMLWLGWRLVGVQAGAQANTSVAIALESLDQGTSLDAFAQQTMRNLRRGLGARFRLPDDPANKLHLLTEGFDPLAYGRMNNAEFVLTGSMRRSGPQVKLTERLIRCATGEVVWRQSSDLSERNAEDGLAAWTKRLVGDIQTKTSAAAGYDGLFRPHVPLPEAQTFYTRAIELTTRDNPHDLDDAVTLLGRAAKLDPKFAMARATLAFALWTQADGYGQWEKLPLAISAAKEALAIDPHCAQAHRVVASCYFKTARNDEAYKEFWKAVDSDPHSAGCCVSLGMYLRAVGQLDGAAAWMTRAIRLEPSRSPLYAILGETLALNGQEAPAESALRRAVELDGDLPEPQFGLIAMQVWRRDYETARAQCAQACLRFPQSRYGSALAGWIELCAGHQSAATDAFKALRAEGSYRWNCKFYGAVNPTSALAYLALKAGLSRESQGLVQAALAEDREILRQFPRNPRVLHDMAATCAVGSDTEQALRLLEEAVSAGWAEFSSTRIDPRFSLVADSPRFQALVHGPAGTWH